MWSFNSDPQELRSRLTTDLSSKARIDVLLALAFFHQQDDAFTDVFSQAEILLAQETTPDLQQVANLLFLRGVRSDTHHGEDVSALEVLEEALALYIEIGDVRGELETRLRLVDLYGDANEFGLAKQTVEASRRLIEENDVPAIFEGRFNYRVALLFLHLELHDLAEEHSCRTLEQGMALYEESVRPKGGRLLHAVGLLQVGPLWILCELCLKQKRYEEAMVYAEQSLKVGREVGVDSWIARVLEQLSKAMLALGQHKNVIAQLKFILGDLSVEQHDVYKGCYAPLGHAYLANGQCVEARKWLERSLALHEHREDIESELACVHALSFVYKTFGEHEKAWTYMDRYAQGMREFWEDEHNKDVMKLSAQHEYALKKQEAELLRVNNEQLVQNNRLLQQAYDEQAELLNIVVHDLNNSLQAVLLHARGASRFVRHNKIEKVAESVDTVRDSATFMGDVIAQLQNMSEVDEGRMEIDIQPVSVSEVIERVLERNRVVAAEKRIDIVTHIPEPLDVLADCFVLQQMFENLLSNSIKYSMFDSTVTVKVYQENDVVNIQWSDNGVGIAPEELLKLFTKFGRLPSSRPTGDERSTGLGLYITKKQVEAMNGTITAESAGLNKGSTFTVSLPIRVKNQHDPSHCAMVYA